MVVVDWIKGRQLKETNCDTNYSQTLRWRTQHDVKIVNSGVTQEQFTVKSLIYIGKHTMADNEQKAIQLVAEAEKKEKSAQGFFSSLFG